MKNANEFNLRFGRLIKKRREELNMTQDELAAKLGYNNKSTICTIEIGRNGIAVNRLPDFIEALDTTLEYLIGWALPDEDAGPATGSGPVSPVPMPVSPDEHALLSLYRGATDFGKGKAVADLENNQSFSQRSINTEGTIKTG